MMNRLSAHMPTYPAMRDRWFIPGAVAGLLLLLDQATKMLVVHTLGPLPGSRQIFLLNDWLSLVYVRNTGIAFGILRNLSGLFIVVSLCISAAVVYVYLFYLPNQSLAVKISTGLILGGALGNMLDRLRLHYVVDFIQVGWWPTFNLADAGITLGVLMLSLYLLLAPLETSADMPTHDEALLWALLAHQPAAAEGDDEYG